MMPIFGNPTMWALAAGATVAAGVGGKSWKVALLVGVPITLILGFTSAQSGAPMFQLPASVGRK